MVTRQITKKKKKTSTPPCIHSVFIIFIYKQLPWISHRLINKRWTGDGRWCLSNRNRFSPVISPHVCVTSLKLKPKHRWPLLETNSSHSLWHSETLPFVKWCDAMILPNALGMRSYKQWSETVKTRYIYSLTSSWKLKKKIVLHLSVSFSFPLDLRNNGEKKINTFCRHLTVNLLTKELFLWQNTVWGSKSYLAGILQTDVSTISVTRRIRNTWTQNCHCRLLARTCPFESRPSVWNRRVKPRPKLGIPINKCDRPSKVTYLFIYLFWIRYISKTQHIHNQKI